MIKFPRTRGEWIVAVVSAVVAFFAGGAVIAATQAMLARLFGLQGP